MKAKRSKKKLGKQEKKTRKPAATNSQKVDYLNIGLMIISLVLAIMLPFKLFLFSYAILGPLHYMTEIGWLQKHNYFTKQKRDYVLLVVLCLVVTLGVLVAESGKWPAFQWFNQAVMDTALAPVGQFLITGQPSFVFIAFVAALAITIFNDWKHRLALIFAGIVLAVALYKLPTYLLLFGVFMPTILHVSLFTGAFILYGAMRSRSSSGYLSFGVFVLCILSFFFIGVEPNAAALTPYVQESFVKSNFHIVNSSIGNIFNTSGEQLTFNSALVWRIQAFIAFSYTYHYLNWFSKTSIIKWHEVPKRSIAASGFIWIASIVLYAIDYRIGLIALFFLSMLHVFLEFPLNHQTFMFIGKRAIGRA